MLVNEMHQGGISALLAYDDTIFDDMVLPTGLTIKEVVDNIVYKYGDTPLAHPDPEVMKYYIPVWSARKLASWNRYKKAIEAVEMIVRGDIDAAMNLFNKKVAPKE